MLINHHFTKTNLLVIEKLLYQENTQIIIKEITPQVDLLVNHPFLTNINLIGLWHIK